MTGTTWRTWFALALALGVAAAGAACRPPDVRATRVRDLIDELPGAERRSRMPPDRAFRLDEVVVDGVARRAILAEAPSRITWRVKVPAHATLRVSAALSPSVWRGRSDGVVFRVGISDGRVYEQLARVYVDPVHEPGDRRWVPLEVDLAAFGGRKFSLFYRPDRILWDLVLATDGGREGQGHTADDAALWGEPVVVSPR